MAIFAKRGRMLLGRAAGTVMDAVTAPMNSRSRRNAEAAVARDRIRAGDREEAARGLGLRRLAGGDGGEDVLGVDGVTDHTAALGPADRLRPAPGRPVTAWNAAGTAMRSVN